jgi:hypothetical protein
LQLLDHAAQFLLEFGQFASGVSGRTALAHILKLLSKS